MFKTTLLLVGVCFLVSTTSFAQLHHNLFPALTGAPLESALVSGYKPTTVLNYARARDTMFSQVYLEQDSVVCIYSQHKVYLPPGTDPTQAVYLNGIQNGINTEHSYPQSKGASEANGNPYSDMHHLYPTRLAVNESRGSLPFKDVPDAQTNKWYYRDQTLTAQPTAASKDLYSELQTNVGFEVRESQKGNIARSVFYFFTMYRSEALAADPVFFEQQRSTLCAWNYADPVDAKEYQRTFKIGSYQDNKPNPFVLDCSLAARTYCSGALAGTCPNIPSSTTEPGDAKPLALAVWPNPTSREVTVKLNIKQAGTIKLTCTSTDGRSQTVLYQGLAHPDWSEQFALPGTGIWLISLEMDGLLLGTEMIECL